MEVLVGVLVPVLRAGACGLRYRVTGRDWADPVSAADGPEGGTSPASSSSAPAPVVRAKPYDIPAPGDDAPNTCTKVTSTGLGAGTFVSGPQTGPRSMPPPSSSPAFIEPFPIVRIAGHFTRRGTTFRRVTVRARRDVRIRVARGGRSCPYRRRAPSAKLVTVHSPHRSYRPGTVVEVRVTQPGRIGKFTRVGTRRGKAPMRLDRCLMPGRTRPVRCPEA